MIDSMKIRGVAPSLTGLAIASLVVLGLAGCQPKTAEAPVGRNTHEASGSPYYWNGPTWVAFDNTKKLSKTCVVTTAGLGEGKQLCQSVECAPDYVPSGLDSCKPGHPAHPSPPSEDRR